MLTPAADGSTTFLEMRDPAQLRPRSAPDARFQVREAVVPQWTVNQFLYNRVGADWHWRDRHRWSEARWRAHVESPDTHTWIAGFEGSLAGYFELRQDRDGAVEIVQLGLMPEFLGRGLGGALLTRALEEAWRLQPRRVWLHTCTLDHPAALANYLARGMTITHVLPEIL